MEERLDSPMYTILYNIWKIIMVIHDLEYSWFSNNKIWKYINVKHDNDNLFNYIVVIYFAIWKLIRNSDERGSYVHHWSQKN